MKTSLNSSAKSPIKIDSRGSRSHLSLVPEAAPSPVVVPGRHYTKEQIRQNRINVISALGAAVGAGVLITMLATRPTAAVHETVPTRDEATVCEVGPGTQEVYFANGDGKNMAILAIKGSGKGEGDPCWSEAAAAVDLALHGNEPQFDGKPVTIPLEVHPVVPPASASAHQNE